MKFSPSLVALILNTTHSVHAAAFSLNSSSLALATQGLGNNLKGTEVVSLHGEPARVISETTQAVVQAATDSHRIPSIGDGDLEALNALVSLINTWETELHSSGNVNTAKPLRIEAKLKKEQLIEIIVARIPKSSAKEFKQIVAHSKIPSVFQALKKAALTYPKEVELLLLPVKVFFANNVGASELIKQIEPQMIEMKQLLSTIETTQKEIDFPEVKSSDAGHLFSDLFNAVGELKSKVESFDFNQIQSMIKDNERKEVDAISEKIALFNQIADSVEPLGLTTSEKQEIIKVAKLLVVIQNSFDGVQGAEYYNERRNLVAKAKEMVGKVMNEKIMEAASKLKVDLPKPNKVGKLEIEVAEPVINVDKIGTPTESEAQLTDPKDKPEIHLIQPETVVVATPPPTVNPVKKDSGLNGVSNTPPTLDPTKKDSVSGGSNTPPTRLNDGSNTPPTHNSGSNDGSKVNVPSGKSKKNNGFPWRPMLIGSTVGGIASAGGVTLISQKENEEAAVAPVE